MMKTNRRDFASPPPPTPPLVPWLCFRANNLSRFNGTARQVVPLILQRASYNSGRWLKHGRGIRYIPRGNSQTGLPWPVAYFSERAAISPADRRRWTRARARTSWQEADVNSRIDVFGDRKTRRLRLSSGLARSCAITRRSIVLIARTMRLKFSSSACFLASSFSSLLHAALPSSEASDRSSALRSEFLRFYLVLLCLNPLTRSVPWGASSHLELSLWNEELLKNVR